MTRDNRSKTSSPCCGDNFPGGSGLTYLPEWSNGEFDGLATATQIGALLDLTATGQSWRRSPLLMVRDGSRNQEGLLDAVTREPLNGWTRYRVREGHDRF